MAANYYQPDLAWIHHAGYSQHVERVAPGIMRLLREAGIAAGARVLDAGCGSGALARKLVAQGYSVHGIDASAAMIDLARKHAPGATFDVVALPLVDQLREKNALATFDAVVSTGHVLNYLPSREAIARALAELADAVTRKKPGLLAVDLMTERFAARREASEAHAKIEDDWAIFTRFSRPAPYRFDRDIAVFRRMGDAWRRSDEHHRNLTFEVDDALPILREHGLVAEVRSAFGEETLPEGLFVLMGRRG
jgi:SAM-dependent methyltransferase